MTTEDFSRLALTFQNTTEAPHFNRIAFKVVGGRIFATLHEEGQSANIMLSVEDQKEFCAMDRSAAYPVPGKWGEKGATTFELEFSDSNIIERALERAYAAASKRKE